MCVVIGLSFPLRSLSLLSLLSSPSSDDLSCLCFPLPLPTVSLVSSFLSPSSDDLSCLSASLPADSLSPCLPPSLSSLFFLSLLSLPLCLSAPPLISLPAACTVRRLPSQSFATASSLAIALLTTAPTLTPPPPSAPDAGEDGMCGAFMESAFANIGKCKPKSKNRRLKMDMKLM